VRARVLAVVVLLAAGCGGAGDDAAVRHAVERWSDAVVARDSRGACAELSRRLRIALERHLVGEGVSGSCATWAARYVSPRNPGAHRGAHVTDADIEGARASVRVSARGAEDARVRLVKEHGRWLIDDY
jgi:hypothetical protein